MLPKAKPLTLLSFASTDHSPEPSSSESGSGFWKMGPKTKQTNKQKQVEPLVPSLPGTTFMPLPHPTPQPPPKEGKAAESKNLAKSSSKTKGNAHSKLRGTGKGGPMDLMNPPSPDKDNSHMSDLRLFRDIIAQFQIP